jgi:hypothetical protein
MLENIKRSLANDLKFGLAKEIDILPTIQGNWEDEPNIRNTKDIYNDEYYPYDFESENSSSWEVKSRRISKSYYPTTIIPVHKVRDVETPQYFIFNFTDACCSIKYDKEVFSKFKTRMIKVERFGGNPNPVNHYEIPVNMLEDLVRVFRIQ